MSASPAAARANDAGGGSALLHAPALGPGPRPLGDIVVCAPLLAREARLQHKPLRAHWAHIVIHGALHLLGFDHARAADARRMEKRERRLLARLGFADPYGA